MATTRINTDILDTLIIGRVEPHIYAFTTETVPNYLKIGDTYRPVNTRIGEWRSIYPNLEHIYTHSARIDDDTIFRDYAVHDFLETEKSKERLQPSDIPDLPYYSREFFKDTTTQDIDEAIEDIAQSAKDNDGRYTLYSSDHLPKTFTYTRGEAYKPRGNQREVIKNFKTAVDKDRTNLLMFAVMRFGKSFTSLCCAKEIEAKLVLVVSAKADVKNEWKKTVESIGNFEGYFFATKDDLLSDDKFLRKSLNEGKRIVLFLTLQDLQGTELKVSHREVFNLCWDMLIVDETHFGARANSYGQILATKKELSKKQINAEIKRQLDGIETLDDVDNVVKELKTRITLHLSGTPYRILMGSEFDKDDIIAFVQFSDIADAQEDWIKEHMFDDAVPEWNNPYFGFPQMIRFAFKPNTASLERLNRLKAQYGATTSFSELFKPTSLTKQPDNTHKQFVHHDVVLDFLKVIDGSKNDSNVLGFLDNERIKDGKLCRHMVFVLPYCASCDAMAEILRSNSGSFRNLSDYEIINISGLDRDKRFNNTEYVKQHIVECEKNGKKTITLTVNRMLTGNTVPQWDTMVFLKQTNSPEEYDQAIFRLQNPYVDEYDDGNGNVIKYNLKPQTILVDFDPERVFNLQERKSQIYNVNTENNGNSHLLERIEKELSISPIITLDHNKLKEVTPNNILDAVRNYAATRSMIDEASDMPIDMSMLDIEEFKKVVDSLNPIDSTKGLSISAHTSDSDDGDDVDSSASDTNFSSTTKSSSSDTSDEEVSDEKILAKKFATYYALILFFSFLTEDPVSNLEDILNVIDRNEDNKRIARNLGLSKKILSLLQAHLNGFALSKLDYKIQNTNSLNHDDGKTPLERVKIALTKFGRMSDSEVVTPLNVAEDVVALLPDDVLTHGPILDIASKQGEFTLAILNRFGAVTVDKVYSVCTSKLAYEFTRKIYKFLYLPIEHIFDSFTSYDIIKKDDASNPDHIQQLKNMNFAAIIGNPPYQEMNQGNGNGSDPIYHMFIDLGMKLAKKSTLIHPARFLFNAGKTPKEWNYSITHNNHFTIKKYWIDSKSIFPDVEITGGIAVSFWDLEANFGVIGTFSQYKELRSITDKVKSATSKYISSIVSPREYYSITETLYTQNPGFENRQSQGHKYSLGANIFDVFPELFTDRPSTQEKYARIFGRVNGQRCYKYCNSDYITHKANFESYKVVISKADGAAGQIGKPIPARIMGKTDIINPNEAYTDSFISIGNFDNLNEAVNCQKYIHTKFARLLLGILKVTQDVTAGKWAFVPLQDFTEGSDIDWSASVADIDKQLYAKYNLTTDEIAFIESMIKPM